MKFKRDYTFEELRNYCIENNETKNCKILRNGSIKWKCKHKVYHTVWTHKKYGNTGYIHDCCSERCCSELIRKIQEDE